MPDFEREVTVPTDPDETFHYLSQPENLPHYIAGMTEAEPESGNRLHVAARIEGRNEEGEAKFQVDRGAYRLEWGAAETGGYHGWLQVEPASTGASVIIHLHVPDDSNAVKTNRILAETTSNIERILAKR